MVDIEIQSTAKGSYATSSLGASEKMLSKIRKELGSLKAKAPSVLRGAINKAAVQTKKALVSDAKSTYTVASSSQDSSKTTTPVASTAKTFKLYRASTQNLSAKLRTNGPMNELGRFKVAPRTIANEKGVKRPKFYKAQVRKDSGGLHALNQSDNKPFWVRFKSGHQALVVRSLTKTMRDGKSPALEKLLGPSNAQIYGKQENVEKIAKTYYPALEQAIAEAVKKTLLHAKTKQGV